MSLVHHVNVLNVNASDMIGGACRAAYRIHRAMVDHGASHGFLAKMRVIEAISDDPTVIAGPPRGQGRLWRMLRPRLTAWPSRRFRSRDTVFHTIAWPGTGLGSELQRRHADGQADIVHLHWLGNATISIEEIGRLALPIVWTLHDQWAFCGAEHYTRSPKPGETCSTDERFVTGYSPDTRSTGEQGPDLNRLTWLRKRRAWKRPMEIVCSSTWLADCARRSALMSQWPISVIPYPLDLSIWAPAEKQMARRLLNLPADKPLILFGAIGGAVDPRKGADLLLAGLHHLRSQVQGTPLANLMLVVFGQGTPAQLPAVDFPLHYAGRLRDDVSLRLLYAAADVMVVPSRQEAFGQTASEAHACGTPVVAFRTGGLIDIVEDKVTGALAEPFDPRSLAAAIRWVLEDQARLRGLGSAARERAERLWNPARVAEAYAAVYRSHLWPRTP